MKHNETNYNYIKNKKNYARVRQDGKDTSLKGDYERKIANEEKYGTNDTIILLGGADRIAGNPPRKIDDVKMKKAYLYGYYERGSRVLEGEFANGIYLSEKQREFGMSDFLYGVPEKFLNSLKQYPSYIEGRIYQMGINAYDYITEKGITIEEYIATIGIIYPEVKEKQFMDGYLSRNKVKKLKKESR